MGGMGLRWGILAGFGALLLPANKIPRMALVGDWGWEWGSEGPHVGELRLNLAFYFSHPSKIPEMAFLGSLVREWGSKLGAESSKIWGFFLLPAQ